ncbi:hypothetical protein LMG33818_000173 [Halomonadaceae bacterium LMG 33818]|uniref:YihY family inner membrane protein n=1 Tax=Cernens ardua TaxID=3402176 RepID=UPI003EDB88E8
MLIRWLRRLAALPLGDDNERRHLWPALRTLYQRFMGHDAFKSAASLTYTTLFAVVPLTAVIYSILSAVPEFQGVGEHMQAYIFDQFVPATGEEVRQQLNNFSTQARNLTFVGVAFLFVTAVMMMVTIEQAFNSIWQTMTRRSGVSSFLMYWAVLTLGPLLLGAAFVASSYITSVRLINDAVNGVGYEHVLSIVSPIMSFVAFLFIYMVIPNAEVKLRHAWVGALITSILIEIAKEGFSLYVTNFPSYQLIYGAFAAVPLFLLWVYVSWLIILLGAEIIAWLGATQSGEWQQSEPMILSIVVLSWLYQAQLDGKRVSSDELAEHVGGSFHDLMQPMQKLGWVVETDESEWVLARSLETLPLWQLLDDLPWKLPDTLPHDLPENVDASLLDERIRSSIEEHRKELSIAVSDLFRTPAQKLAAGTDVSK